MELQKTMNSQLSLQKEQDWVSQCDITLSNFKIYFQATVTKQYTAGIKTDL